MSSINNINNTTLNQYNALAPFVLQYDRKRFVRSSSLFDNANNTTTMKYESRRQRGAFIKDQLSVVVRYDDASDLYDIEIIHSNGKTFDNTSVFKSEGHFFDSFADIQNFINLQRA